MLAIKRLVTVLVMVFVLTGLLLVLVPSVRSSAEGMFSSGPVGLYYALFLAGLVLLGLQLITENLDSALLRREVAAHNSKVNELKAKLYDHQADQRAREFQQRPTATTAIPPDYGTQTSRPAPSQPAPDAEHPTFPQSDPGLLNRPLDQPNSIINTPPDPTNRPAL
ncbi:hypothetical protein SAMN02745146_0405 [Hymenobacter daecheongensis DSM 21074]|uniref:Lipopolysaccharide assembly protein A domain-containing protein n=1 Tax=Hymenobacter daecheongensis DSM 21074 TaxID=1121955 RepID=A0A1M5ZZ03_9BACT|nr:hypothetical protein [Hymenobacter daecheongensis]SHI29481.1 hypothetical protein SAMN02745146_0405 [Hymenobacter daecheongensis DSM 21074]